MDTLPFPSAGIRNIHNISNISEATTQAGKDKDEAMTPVTALYPRMNTMTSHKADTRARLLWANRPSGPHSALHHKPMTLR